MNLQIKNTPIDVTPITEEDPNWTEKCSCGIIHSWHSCSEEWPESPAMCKTFTPTLKFIIDRPASDDYPAVNHYECIECGEEIDPQYRTVSQRYYVKGRTEYYLDGNLITEEEAKKLIKRIS